MGSIALTKSQPIRRWTHLVLITLSLTFSCTFGSNYLYYDKGNFNELAAETEYEVKDFLDIDASYGVTTPPGGELSGGVFLFDRKSFSCMFMTVAVESYLTIAVSHWCDNTGSELYIQTQCNFYTKMDLCTKTSGRGKGMWNVTNWISKCYLNEHLTISLCGTGKTNAAATGFEYIKVIADDATKPTATSPVLSTYSTQESTTEVPTTSVSTTATSKMTKTTSPSTTDTSTTRKSTTSVSTTDTSKTTNPTTSALSTATSTTIKPTTTKLSTNPTEPSSSTSVHTSDVITESTTQTNKITMPSTMTTTTSTTSTASTTVTSITTTSTSTSNEKADSGVNCEDSGCILGMTTEQFIIVCLSCSIVVLLVVFLGISSLRRRRNMEFVQIHPEEPRYHLENMNLKLNVTPADSTNHRNNEELRIPPCGREEPQFMSPGPSNRLPGRSLPLGVSTIDAQPRLQSIPTISGGRWHNSRSDLRFPNSRSPYQGYFKS